MEAAAMEDAGAKKPGVKFYRSQAPYLYGGAHCFFPLDFQWFRPFLIFLFVLANV
jgi:hypothetical protein